MLPVGNSLRRLSLALTAAGIVAAGPLAPPGATGGGAQAQARAPRPAHLPQCHGCNVLLISIDTVRADHLGAYGYARDTSPNIDRLARRSLRFERAYSSSYVTADSHMSMFTSLDPSVHGVRNAAPTAREALRLHDAIQTLPGVLQAAGYATAAFTGGGNVDGIYGFDRGMDRYESPASTAQALQRARRYIRGAGDKPYFLFFHTYHAHDPYTPEDATLRRFAHRYGGRIQHAPQSLAKLRKDGSFLDARRVFWSLVDQDSTDDVQHLEALYDAELRETDRFVGGLVQLARRTHPNTLVMLVSDHGEQFGEHGGFLHNELYEELIHVPFILSHPRPNPGTFPAPVSLVDLAPTTLAMLGIEAPGTFQGRDLRPVVQGHEAPRDVFAQKAGERSALIRGNDKLMRWFHPSGKVRLTQRYELGSDPREQHPLSVDASHPLAQAMDRHVRESALRFQAIRGTQQQRAPVALDDSTVSRLRALGYMQ